MTQWMVSGTLGFIAGGAFIWFAKDMIQLMVIGANNLSAKMHKKADAITRAWQ